MFKKISAILLSSYIIEVVFGLVFSIFYLKESVLISILGALTYPIFHILLFLIYFLPVILFINYLIDKQKSKITIIVATTISSAIYLIIPIIIFGDFGYSFIPLIIINIFTLLLASVIIPKSILPEKKDIALTLLITLLSCITISFLSHTAMNRIEKTNQHKVVKNFEPVVEYIEDYKQNNGEYPAKDNEELNSLILNILDEKYNKHIYNYYPNETEYKIIIPDKMFYQYQYCSNVQNCEGEQINGNWFYVYVD